MKQIKTDTQKNLTNTQIMILGITSLWLIIPSIYGLFLNINNVKQNINTYNIIYIINIVICVYISIVSIVSTIYWYKWLTTNEHYNIYYYLDCILASILFICLIVLSCVNYNNVPTIYKILLPLVICICFGLNKYYYSKKIYKYSFICHSFFRYLGYLWTHSILLDNHTSLIHILILSIIYWGHILFIYLCNNLDCNTTLECKKNKYIKECLILFIIIIICLIIQFYYYNLLK